jgi:hypothetical protein
MVATGQSMLLGYTDAFYNGASVVRSERPVHAAVGHADAPHNYSQAAFNVAGPAGNGDYTVTVTNEGVHDFTWTIELPPWPPVLGLGIRGWLSGLKSPRQILNSLHSARYTIDNTLRPDYQLIAPKTAEARILIVPQPNAETFDNHIAAHETQHVRDHRALADAIFGPIDTWLYTVRTKQLQYVGSEVAGIKSHLNLAGKYSLSQHRILRYWITCCGQSGDLYHATRLGTAPKLRWIGTTYNDAKTRATVLLHLAAEQLMPGFPAGPHGTFFNLHPLNRELDGQEDALRADGGAAAARVIKADNVPTLANGAAVNLDLADNRDLWTPW